MQRTYLPFVVYVLSGLIFSGLIPLAEVTADEAVLPPGGGAPQLRLETNGPRSNVNGLAFSPDGKRLYAVGWDKAVQVWDRNVSGAFQHNAQGALRTPVGPGIYGQLFAIALSDDGRWLATAGAGTFRELAGERDSGWIQSANNLSLDSQLDIGLIYVFDTVTGATKLLRGHRDNVCALGFVQGCDVALPKLVSIGEDRTDKVDTFLPTIRYWDVVNAIEIAQLKSIPSLDGKSWGSLPNLKGAQPGLTAWSTGKQLNEARVALAWSDNQFRVWDTKSGQVASVDSGSATSTALALDAKRVRILAAGNSYLGVWQIPSTERGTLAALSHKLHFQDSQIESLRGRGLEKDGIVSAAAIIPNENPESARAIFVVTRGKSGPYTYRLVITTTSSPIRAIREIELPWSGIRRPSLAVSRDGRTVAIAGNERAEIEVYSTEDLVAGKPLQPQRLASEALLFKDAQFVRRENDWGLRLGRSRRGEPDKVDSEPLILNINERRIETNSPDWRTAIVQKTGWSVIDYKTPGKITVSRPGNGGQLELNLEEQFLLTAIAFCPLPAGCDVPLIAVACERHGETKLQLFNGSTGEQVRQFTGHTEMIRSLSFSEDGRMLISAADDRTVSVWTISDLGEKTLGKRGMIRGLSLEENQGRLVVKGTSNQSAFEQNDEIIGGDRQGEIVEFSSKKDFFKYVRDHKPGEVINLTVRRNGKIITVAGNVAQAVDEVKPLFTLFVVPAENGREWEWIGWNPLGFFDARGDRVDQWLGWHFNTGEPDRPAKFAVLGEYRDQFFHRGLLTKLVEFQKLPPNAPPPPEDPKVSFFLQHFDGTPFRRNYDDVTQLETTQIEISATAKGTGRHARDLKLHATIESIEHGNPQSFELKSIAGSDEWVGDLSSYSWSRGPHRLIVEMQVLDRVVKSIERVEYRPNAPEVSWSVDPKWIKEFNAAEITVNATVAPSTEQAHVQLLLQRPGSEEQIEIRHWDVREPLTIVERVAIEPGENRLEIRSWNSSAPPNDREIETTHSHALIRRPAPPMAPTIEFEKVSTVLDQNTSKMLSPDPSAADTYETLAPLVRIRGNITAKEKLERAALSLRGESRTLIGPDPANPVELTFEETLTLNPGRNSVVVAAVVGDVPSERRLNFIYEPPVPRIVEMKAAVNAIQALPSHVAQVPNIYYSGYHEPVATVSAKLTGLLEHPYEVTLRVNDVVVNEHLRIDRSRPDAHLLEATIPLKGGPSLISFHVRNEWTRKSETEELGFDFRRVPEIVALDAPSKLIEKPLELSCRIHSVLPIRSTKIVLDETHEIPGTLSPIAGNPDQYLLEATKTGIAQGKHVIQITASNDEGSALTPAIHEVNVEQAIQPPKIDIVYPTSTTPSPSKQLAIQFTVKSAEPTTIAIKCQGTGTGDVIESSTDSVPADGTVVTVPIELFAGPNTIELTAHNRGGYSEKQLITTSYVSYPAAVEILSVDGKRPLWRDGKGILDSSVSKAHVMLEGRVKIKERSTLGRHLKARIWVNGFMQTADVTFMDSEGVTTGRFSSLVTLDRPKRNEIKVQVYDGAGKSPSFVDDSKTLNLDCDKHEKSQDLYLLLLGTGDADVLRESAMKALHVKIDSKKAYEETWHSDFFSSVHVVNALNVHPKTADKRLGHLFERMRKDFNRKRMSSGVNGILMVYFQGKLVLTGQDFEFITDKLQRPSDPDALTGIDLQKRLNETQGAHLLFLDLNQKNESVTVQDIWPKAPQLGIVIANWMGQGEQPGETRLISALNQALPQIRVVRELASTMDERFQSARQQFPGQIEARVDLLNDVQDVRIGLE